MGIQNLRVLNFGRFVALALTAAAAACSSSGGGGGISATSESTGTPISTTALTQPPEVDSLDTGIAGTVAAPAAATFGSASSQPAAPGGPTFDGSNGSYASNITFPLIISGLQKTSTGLSPTPADSGATLTVVSNTSNASNVQLIIPSLGINQSISMHTNLGDPDNEQPLYGLSYAAVGGWAVRPSTNTNQYGFTSGGAYVFGFETPQTAMPTSGTAVFSGPELATATIYKTIGTEIQTGNVEGNASISVNFGSGAISGSFTGMMVTNTEHWNDVSVTANIATGTNRFSGATAAASAPGAPMSLSGAATGSINGAFYGPAAQNLGAVWSLSDGTGSALGTVLAGH